MKGFYIQVKNDLLEPKHRQRMGSAVWEFMWFLDKITKIESGFGYVLGGKPIQLRHLQADLGGAASTVSENISKLEREGYIATKRTPYGLIILVRKAAKKLRAQDVHKSKREFGFPKQI